jgi:hypothetical protein
VVEFFTRPVRVWAEASDVRRIARETICQRGRIRVLANSRSLDFVAAALCAPATPLGMTDLAWVKSRIPFMVSIMVARSLFGRSWLGSARRGGFGFQSRDFGQERGGFVLQGRFQRLVVDVGHFAGFEFEVQVAQVFIHGVFALAQVRGARFLLAKIKFAGSENVKQRGSGRQQDSRPVRWS